MPKRENQFDDPYGEGLAPASGDTGGSVGRRATVLCLDADAEIRGELARTLAGLPILLHDVTSIEAAREALEHNEYDVVLIDTDAHGGAWADLAHERGVARSATRAILTTRRPTLEAAVGAMRAGAIDLLRKPFDPEEVASRLLAAVDRAEEVRRQQRRVERLKRICRRLDTARQEVSREVDTLCQDLVSAYQKIAGQMDDDRPAGTIRPEDTVAEPMDGMDMAEFSPLIRGELDVEKLLRTTLEYILGRVGPINAAVFLPTGADDYSLGAYVNLDIPRAHADVMLDHLADVLPARFEHEATTRVFSGEPDIRAELPDAAEWLGDRETLITSCRHDGECLAVIALFRDRPAPFDEEAVGEIQAIRDAFGEQLARVIRIHNRHRDPDELVTGFDVDLGGDADEFEDPFFDDYDIAA